MPTANAAHAHTIRPGVFELDTREIGGAVGSEVACRVAQFIKKLLSYRAEADTTARTWVLCYDEGAIRFGLDKRVPDVRKVRD